MGGPNKINENNQLGVSDGTPTAGAVPSVPGTQPPSGAGDAYVEAPTPKSPLGTKHAIQFTPGAWQQLVDMAHRLQIAPERIPVILYEMRPAGKFDPAKLAERIGAITQAAVVDWVTQNTAWFHAHRHEIEDTYGRHLAAHAPGFAFSILGLLGAIELCDLLKINDPSERFAFIIYSTHYLHTPVDGMIQMVGNRIAHRPFDMVHLAETEEAGKVVYEARYLLRGNFAASLWKACVLRLVPEGATLLQKTANGLIGTLTLLPRAALGMGPDILFSEVGDASVGELLEQRWPTTFADHSPAREYLKFGFFFTLPAVNVFTHGLAQRWLTSTATGQTFGLTGRLFGAAFLMDLGMMITTRLLRWNDAQAIYTYRQQVADAHTDLGAKFADIGLFRVLRAATLAGEGPFAQVIDASEAAQVRLGLLDERATAAAVREQVWANNAELAGQLAVLVKQRYWQWLTMAPAAAVLASLRDSGWLDRIELGRDVTHYQPDLQTDGTYNQLRFLSLLRIHDSARPISAIFSEDFLGSERSTTPPAEVLEDPIIAHPLALLDWLGGETAILAARRQVFATLLIDAELQRTHGLAQMETEGQTDAQALAAAEQLLTFGKTAGRVRADGSLDHDAAFYIALYRYAKLVTARQDPEKLPILAQYVSRRAAMLLRPDLPGHTKLEILTEATLVPLDRLFSRRPAGDRTALQVRKLMDNYQSAMPELLPSPIPHPPLDPAAMDAMRLAATDWLGEAEGAVAWAFAACDTTGGFPSPDTADPLCVQSIAETLRTAGPKAATDIPKNLPSEHREREGGTQQAWPVGGATRAPVMELALERYYTAHAASLADLPDLLRHAAFYNAHLPEPLRPFADGQLDPITGMPVSHAAVSRWLQPSRRAIAEHEMKMRPGFRDDCGTYVTAKHAEQKQLIEAHILPRLTQWWLEGVTEQLRTSLTVDTAMAMAFVQERFRDPVTGPPLRREIAQMRHVTDQLAAWQHGAELICKLEGRAASTVGSLGDFYERATDGPGGDITDWSLVRRWMQPHLAPGIGNLLEQLESILATAADPAIRQRIESARATLSAERAE